VTRPKIDVAPPKPPPRTRGDPPGEWEGGTQTWGKDRNLKVQIETP